MMIAKKAFPWGSIEVRFEMTSRPPDALTILRIVMAHQEVMAAILKLETPREREPTPVQPMPTSRCHTCEAPAFSQGSHGEHDPTCEFYEPPSKR